MVFGVQEGRVWQRRQDLAGFLEAVERMLTFEQLQPALHKWAYRFRNPRFEHWELINEVWARGKVQKLPHINLASICVKRDMIDYMREETSMRIRKRHNAKGKFYPTAISLNALLTDDKREIGSLLGSMEDQASLDTEDYFEWLLKGLSRRCKLIMVLKYQCGYNLYEIGKIIGVTRTRAWHLHKVTLLHLRDKLVRAGQQPQVCNRATSFGTQDEDKLRLYNRMYYLRNKDRIQQRRKAIREKKTA